uniref:Uncharacterized protein n=1 Tax=Anguilla anguilla TaxID=7936 RepID=A0A0E9SG65_ANGAN
MQGKKNNNNKNK